MRYLVFSLTVAATALVAGCAGPSAVGEPPSTVSYEEWGARMALIPEIIDAEHYVEAGLVRHRNSKILSQRHDIFDELTEAIKLFAIAADLYYLAWDNYPDYEKFILLELDKVYVYMHACVADRPHFFDPTDPLNIYGGALTYEQRQKMQQYRQRLRRWEKTSGR